MPLKGSKPLRSSAQVTVMFMIVKHRIFPPVGGLKFSIVWIFSIGHEKLGWAEAGGRTVRKKGIDEYNY